MEKEKKYGSKKDVIIVNSVTALRFLGSFLVIPVFKALGGISAAIFSAIFLFTDFIDGTLARKLKASTFFGALFDGLCDKAFGIICFALLMTINPVVFSIPLLMEVGIVLAQNKKFKNNQNVKSNMIGKAKTWFLSASIVGSFIAVDLLNIPPLLDYIKYASLDKVASIKESLILLGIELPSIVAQILTLGSYIKETSAKTKEDDKEINLDENLKIETTPVIEEELNYSISEELNEINQKRQSLYDEKRQILEEKKSLLEKAKIIGNAMFDPEYYANNKDMPIRTLAKELLEKNKSMK